MHDGFKDVLAPPSPTMTSQETAAAAPLVGGSDLSRDIERLVGREPLDRVRCTRVFGDFYRCNWWAPPGGPPRSGAAEWLTIPTQRVRKSSFLNATASDGQLLMTEVSDAGPE
jgi:hypothetical protein